jgi:hypothetical protein
MVAAMCVKDRGVHRTAGKVGDKPKHVMIQPAEFTKVFLVNCSLRRLHRFMSASASA